jgi:hypothetical protein
VLVDSLVVAAVPESVVDELAVFEPDSLPESLEDCVAADSLDAESLDD